MITLSNKVQYVEAEKEKYETEIRMMSQENARLRDKLAIAEQKFHQSLETVVQLEEHKKHFAFMNSLEKFDLDQTVIRSIKF